MSDFIDHGLPPLRARPWRLFSFVRLDAELFEYVLIVREWWDQWEEPVVSIYGVQAVPFVERNEPGQEWLFVRVNPQPSRDLVKDYDDGEDATERLFRCVVPYGSAQARCDCKGYRTFVRCRHVDCFTAIERKPAQTSEATSDAELESWVCG